MTGLRRFALYVLMAAMSCTALAIEVIDFRDAAEEQRFRELAAELRCLVCQNQSLDDSSASLAQDLRNEVLLLMREGKDNTAIKAYLVDRYGDFVLYRPRFTPATVLLWAGPGVLLLAGLLLVFRSLRRMQKQVPAATSTQQSTSNHNEPPA